MRYDWRNNSVLFLHNLSAEPQEVRLSVARKGEDAGTLVNLLSEDHSYSEKNGKHCILLEPYGYRWFRVGGLDYLLRRSEV
jgi:maltose alpha-D-glucosyltransferase/alpha-amylase